VTPHHCRQSGPARAGSDSLLTTVVSVDPIYAKLDADENAVLKYVKLSEEGKRVSARTAQDSAWVELGNETDFPHKGTIDFVDNRLDPERGRCVPGSF
jgi:hypothetical protein